MTRSHFRLHRSKNIDYIRADFGPECGAAMWVSTRRGGCSFNENGLNLSYGTGDADENVRENRRRFLQSIGAQNDRIVGLRQIHSATVHLVTAENISDFAKRNIEGDGMITQLTDTHLSISVGDCLPIGLFDPDNRAIGMLHAGWKGTARRIAEAGIGAMHDTFDSKPEQLRAVIGPGIGFSSYQVDGPVMDEFREYWTNWANFFHDRSSSHGFVDLAGANRWLLEHCGVLPERIQVIDLCTHTLEALFFSHRRDGLPGGRMFAMGSVRDNI